MAIPPIEGVLLLRAPRGGPQSKAAKFWACVPPASGIEAAFSDSSYRIERENGAGILRSSNRAAETQKSQPTPRAVSRNAPGLGRRCGDNVELPKSDARRENASPNVTLAECAANFSNDF